MTKFKTKINDLGKVPPTDRMYKRGYTVNVAPNAVKPKSTTKKPGE